MTCALYRVPAPSVASAVIELASHSKTITTNAFDVLFTAEISSFCLIPFEFAEENYTHTNIQANTKNKTKNVYVYFLNIFFPFLRAFDEMSSQR